MVLLPTVDIASLTIPKYVLSAPLNYAGRKSQAAKPLNGTVILVQQSGAVNRFVTAEPSLSREGMNTLTVSNPLTEVLQTEAIFMDDDIIRSHSFESELQFDKSKSVDLRVFELDTTHFEPIEIVQAESSIDYDLQFDKGYRLSPYDEEAYKK